MAAPRLVSSRATERPPTSYEQYYCLQSSPFSLTPNPQFLYEGRSHSDALDQVTRALRRREGFVVITGEIGVGKTMLCRLLVDRLEPRTFLSEVRDPGLTRYDLLKQILTDFGALDSPQQPTSATEHDLVRALHQFIGSLTSIRARAVVIVDEAQQLQAEVLEQIRLLSNFEPDANPSLQLILVGQPQLGETIDRPELASLKQRITRRIRLEPLDRSEVEHYIERRLWVAHGGPEVALNPRPQAIAPSSSPTDTFWRVRFTAAATHLVAALSNGIPRVVNVVCDRALEVGHERRTRTIDVAEVAAAAKLLQLQVPEIPRKYVPRRRIAAAAAALAGIVTLGGWWALRSSDAPATAVPAIGMTATASAAPLADGRAGAATTGASPNPLPDGGMPAPQPLRVAESFTVSVASFRSERRAAAVSEQLAAMGLPAFTRWDPSGWHQIVVGPYASSEEALAAQQQLRTVQFPDTRIVSSMTTRPASTNAG